MLHPRRIAAAFACAALLCAFPGHGQKHSFGSSPPTAPPPPAPRPPAAIPGSVAPVSQGVGPLQFTQVNYGVLAPQAISRQLQAEDERTRLAALSSIGVPNQYLTRGHVPFPHSLRLDFVALGTTDELDAILTLELDQHLVSAILRPDESGWRRIASVVYATAFVDGTSNPGSFLRTARSVIQPERYRAVFRGATRASSGDYVESEANVRVLNDRAVVTLSYTSEARICADPATHPGRSGCDLTERWIEADPSEPTKRLTLVTATGHVPARESGDAVFRSRTFLASHLRTFSCQPFVFSDTNLHFEAAANAAPCTSR